MDPKTFDLIIGGVSAAFVILTLITAFSSAGLIRDRWKQLAACGIALAIGYGNRYLPEPTQIFVISIASAGGITALYAGAKKTMNDK